MTYRIGKLYQNFVTVIPKSQHNRVGSFGRRFYRREPAWKSNAIGVAVLFWSANVGVGTLCGASIGFIVGLNTDNKVKRCILPPLLTFGGGAWGSVAGFYFAPTFCLIDCLCEETIKSR